MMASMGGVIGSGWLFGSYYGAKYAGPGAIISWIIGGILMLAIALPWAELGGLVPEAGSVARVPRMTHGMLVGGIASWAIAVGATFAAPVESLAVVHYASGYIQGLYNAHTDMLTGLGTFFAGVLVVVFFVINYYGVRWLRNTNTWWTTVKWIVPTVAMIVVIISGFANGGGHNITSGPGGFMPFGMHGVLAAISIGGMVYAYSGFRQSLDLAAEGKNPQRDVPMALVTVMLFALGLYTLLQVALIVALPAADLAHGWQGLNLTSPLAQLAAGLDLGWLATVLYIDGAVSPAGSANLFTGTASRLLYATRKNGFYIRGFQTMSDRGIPIVAQLVILVAGILAILPIPSWHTMIELTSALGLITYAVGGPSLTVMRRIGAHAERKFTLGRAASWMAPACFAIGALLFYWFGWPTTLRVDILMLLGLVIYAIYHAVYHYPARDITAGIWMVVFMAFIGVFSYFGSFGSGNVHLIPFPWDSLIVIIVALAIHYWGVASGYATQDWIDFQEHKNRDLQQSEVAN